MNFAQGDGHDTVYAGSNTTVEFGEGITADNTHISVTGNVATIKFAGSDDTISLHLQPFGPATLALPTADRSPSGRRIHGKSWRRRQPDLSCCRIRGSEIRA